MPMTVRTEAVRKERKKETKHDNLVRVRSMLNEVRGAFGLPVCAACLGEVRGVHWDCC